ncbi:MAG: dicarboxylate/amino acid:cation symporter [Phycisphaeraceae bacterium]|nr:dicarboxylate/amino acid:cation symporter [Phycisphaeraceae bacterium]
MAGTRRIALHWKIVIALVLGVGLGLALNQWWTAETWRGLGVGDAGAFLAGKASEANAQADWRAQAALVAARAAAFAGLVFLNLLRFVAVPLVLFSLISAAAGMGDVRRLGRLGGRTVALFAVTLAAAIAIGLAGANLVRPGAYVPEAAREALAAGQTQAVSAAAGRAADHGFWSILSACVPTNPFDALARADMMQIVVMALLIGACLTLLPREKSGPVSSVCDGLYEVFLKIVGVVMRLAPLAVFCLMARTASQLGLDVVKALGVFCLVVVGCLLAQVVLVYLPIVAAVGRMGVGRFVRGIAEAQLVAFTTSSSAATLPVTMRCVEERLGVPKEVVSFVCAAGTTINMDGTALYQTVVALFVAQMYGVDLSLGQQVTIARMAALASVGAPGIPSGGTVLLVGVLQSVGLPVEGIGVILGVDRLMDMCRTVVNVTGDAVGSVVVARWGGAGGAGTPAPAA